MQHGTCYFVKFSIDVQCGRRMSWINPEPIAPAAPILVHREVQDGYLQQHGAEDRMNIEVITSTEPRLPKKEPSSTNTGTCVRQEADDRIDILEFELDNERQAGKAATPAALRAPDPVIEELEGDPRYRCLRAQIDHDSPHWSQNNCCKSCRKCITNSECLCNDKLQHARWDPRAQQSTCVHRYHISLKM